MPTLIVIIVDIYFVHFHPDAREKKKEKGGGGALWKERKEKFKQLAIQRTNCGRGMKRKVKIPGRIRL